VIFCGNFTYFQFWLISKFVLEKYDRGGLLVHGRRKEKMEEKNHFWQQLCAETPTQRHSKDRKEAHKSWIGCMKIPIDVEVHSKRSSVRGLLVD
jgi:hypothetical protein